MCEQKKFYLLILFWVLPYEIVVREKKAIVILEFYNINKNLSIII